MIKKNARLIKTLENGTESVSALRKDAQMHLADARAQFTKAEQQVKKYADKHPERAALIATAVGVGIGAAVTAVLMRKRNN